MEKTNQDKYSVDKLDMRTTKGSSFIQTKKEAKITIIAYLSYAIYGIIVAALFGYGEDISYMAGIPTWIVLGIFIPTIAICIYLAIYLKFVYKD